ncbi:hypothetical protein TNCV_1669341 [Trichonephila clavipes]|nr:hypothetical protein TNCV_1669341 [Trichonephila clavipes]
MLTGYVVDFEVMSKVCRHCSVAKKMLGQSSAEFSYMKDAFDVEHKMQTKVCSMIWAKCPKEIFVNKRRVKRAVTEAVCEFNKGTVRTIVETQKALSVATGGSTKQLATILDCRKQKI